MSKRTIIIIGAILTVLFGAGIGVFVFSQKQKSADSGERGLTQMPLLNVNLPGSSKLTTYQDESGYSFSYDEAISVKDVTPDDDNYYSSLELTKGNETLTVKITVGNTNPYKTNKSAVLTGSTTMGSISASQYKLGGRLISVAIDQGVLYVIDGPADGGYWEEVQSKILSSFKFGTASAEAETTTTENAVYEEEVVE